MKRIRTNYFILLLLGLIFAAPGIAAFFFYMHPAWLVSTRTNKGKLLNPPVMLAHSQKPSKWQLILWDPNGCEQSCIAELDKLGRIRLALGRHLYKVQTQLLLDAEAPQLSESLVQALQDQDIKMIRISKEKREGMPVLHNHMQIFIANPENYLVLVYLPTVKPNDIFHDLKKLVTK